MIAQIGPGRLIGQPLQSRTKRSRHCGQAISCHFGTSWNLHPAATRESGSILLDSHAQSLSHQRVEAKARAGAKQAGGRLPAVKVVQEMAPTA
ncbi:MAG: hypothetical protein E5X62_24270 [Mesorhizobium sp.]|nr:MAG: hypothetical protein E5X62_24270 [Mesorhizobium sp.]